MASDARPWRDFLRATSRGRGPAQIVAESDRLVRLGVLSKPLSLSIVAQHLNTGGPLSAIPHPDTLEGYAAALPAKVSALVRAAWEDIPDRMPWEEAFSLFEQELPPGLDVLDRYPRLRQTLLDHIEELLTRVRRLDELEAGRQG